MKSSLSHKMHDYAPLLADMQSSGVGEGCKTNGKAGSSRKEKYALRERQKRRHGLASVVEMPKRSSHKDDIELTAGPPQRTQNATAAKSKAPPLSKYRRKTANARERTRMREINSAFENLRHCVPQSIAADETGPTNEKLTKITTLRLAMKYINLLTNALHNPNFNGELPMDFLYPMNDNDEDDDDEDDETKTMAKPKVSAKLVKLETKTNQATAAKTAKPTSKAATARAKVSDMKQKPPKRLAKRKKKDSTASIAATSKSVYSKGPESTHSHASSTISTSSSFVSCSGDSSLSSISSSSSFLLDNITSPSYSNSFVPSMTELNSLKLESDGESLHLSDPCNSPLQDNFDSLFSAGTLHDNKPLVEHSILGDIDTPLELSLQLLGTTPQGLEFSMEQPPTTCISPLAALDSFNPFSDFLQEYPEQASLDLFLT